MEKTILKAGVLGLTALLLAGCGDDSADKAATQSDMKQSSEMSSSTEGKSSEPTMTEQAKDTMGDAAEAADQAAESAAQTMEEQAEAAQESMAAAADQAAEKMDEMKSEVESAASGKSGEEVYKSICFSCHDSGIAGAPKLGEKAAWEPRIATGKEALYDSALNGKGAMPAKGGNPGLSDADVKSAVDFMVSQVQ